MLPKQKVPKPAQTATGVGTAFLHEGSAPPVATDTGMSCEAIAEVLLPDATRGRAWIEKECGIAYQGRSGLIALPHCLGMEHRKPKTVSRKLDPEKQAAFIKAYEELLNHLDADEAAERVNDFDTSGFGI